jgi:protein SCO1/2
MRTRLTIFLCMLALSLPAAASPQGDLEEHLGARLPLEQPFVDQDGRHVRLADQFRDGKPVLLVLAYFRCQLLCDLVLRGAVQGIGRQGLQLGRDFRALTISFDPRDTPGAASLKQHGYLQSMNRLDALPAWPFLVGEEPAIRALAKALGYIYAYDAATDQYAHPAAVFVLTPDGRISRYLYGVELRGLDVRLALDEAGRGRIGTLVDRVLLTCFRYDPSTRRYAVYVRGVMQGGSLLVLLLVAGGVGGLWWRERRRRIDR